MLKANLFFVFCFVVLSSFVSGCAFRLTEKQQEKLDRLERNTTKSLVDVQDKTEEYPESSLAKKTKLIDDILKYTDAVRKEPEKFNDEKVDNFSKKIDILRSNIDNSLDLKMDSDISFNMGEYKISGLSGQAKVDMDNLVSKMISLTKKNLEKYPKEKFFIHLKVVGYTDETPFRRGTTLERELISKINNNIPSDEIERRKVYNKALSEFRAETLYSYIYDSLTHQIDNLNFSKKIIIGYGEEMPNKKKQIQYEAKDSRRRICMILSLIDDEAD